MVVIDVLMVVPMGYRLRATGYGLRNADVVFTVVYGGKVYGGGCGDGFTWETSCQGVDGDLGEPSKDTSLEIPTGTRTGTEIPGNHRPATSGGRRGLDPDPDTPASTSSEL